MESVYNVAGIDVHKKMLAVVIANAHDRELQFECRKFGTTVSELRRLVNWLQMQSVQEAAMESTAQYWKPVWIALEGHCRLHLAQAKSNRGPRGRKTDFRDAMRIVNRLLSGELILSYVPNMEQRCWRTLTRSRHQLRQDRVRLQNQLECLLEEVQIKLSSLLSDLLGQSGRRILRALADGEANPTVLASLASGRLRATREELQDSLSGKLLPLHRQVLSLYLERLDLIESQMESLEKSVAQSLQAHQDSVARLVEIPGVGVDSAQQIIAEVGPLAAAFPSAAQLASWVGVCPGRQESAGISYSNRSAKGNPTMRRLLNQMAHAAVKQNGCYFQILFRRWLPRLGYKKAIWAVAHRICRLIWKVLHEGVRYVHRGLDLDPKAVQQKRRRLVAELRLLGYKVDLAPLDSQTAPGMSM
jgi:transposase